MSTGLQTRPLVTFVMTVWRPHLDWLEQAVRSVLEQEGCALELVLVDDGCEPPVSAVLRVDDPRLRHVQMPHGGLYRARNAGVAAGQGDYVRFVDADDVFPRSGTKRLLALANGRQNVIAFGATLRCGPDLTPQRVETCSTSGDAALECFLGGFPVRHMSMLFPRRVLAAVGEWDPAFPACGDWDYVLRALGHATVAGTADVVTWYRNHPAAMSADIDACTAGMRRVVERHVERRPGIAGTRLHRMAEAQVEVKLSRSYFDRGEVRRGLDLLRRAVAVDPRTGARGALGRVPALARISASRASRAVGVR